MLEPTTFAEEMPCSHIDENVKGMLLVFQKQEDLTLAHCRWRVCPLQRGHSEAAQLDEVKR